MEMIQIEVANQMIAILSKPACFIAGIALCIVSSVGAVAGIGLMVIGAK